jgi:hypothetical protein
MAIIKVVLSLDLSVYSWEIEMMIDLQYLLQLVFILAEFAFLLMTRGRDWLVYIRKLRGENHDDESV